MNISVIIPVYNAEKFLARAIESVLIQPEATEIMLVEDCSPDNSLEICKHYEQKYPDRVKLYQHADKQNHGAGETRNLGIKMAKGDYIAFLDADDFFLPDRFKESVKILENDNGLDGTHGLLGVHFENEEAKKFNLNGRFNEPTGIKSDTDPEDLLVTILNGKYGHISLDTVVVKKELIEKCGYFNSDLKQCQDSNLILKLTATGKLFRLSGNKIIAMRVVHEDNRIHNIREASSYQIQIIPDLLKWGKTNKKIQDNYRILEKRYFVHLETYSKLKNNKFWYFNYINLIFTDKNTDFKLKSNAFFYSLILLAQQLYRYLKRYPFFMFRSQFYKSLRETFLVKSKLENRKDL